MQPNLPQSAVGPTTILAGLGGGCMGLMASIWLSPNASLIFMLLACGAPMWWIEWRKHTNTTIKRPPASRQQIRRRLQGMVIVGGLLMVYSLIQLHLGVGAITNLVDAWPFLAATFFTWGVALVKQGQAPEGSLEILVRSVEAARNGQWNNVDRQCLLGWAVKIFFLPLMLAWALEWTAHLSLQGGVVGLLQATDRWVMVVGICVAILYAFDTLFGTIGYMSTWSGIDGHIRSTDNTWLGWGSALVCYPPFNLIVLRQWLEYHDGLEWHQWLQPGWALYAWGGAIIITTAIYAFATVVFGPRFSNLTHRGIITSGPFRWTKHPAYISKNISWWLVSVPFISMESTSTAIIHCMALLCVNGIYTLRAKTEERHLMRDPVYQEYAQWIEVNGIFAHIKHAMIPVRRYE